MQVEPETLSQREVEVLRLLALGMVNREIALTLHISVRTAEFHRLNLRRKLEATSRSELVARARVYGLGVG